MTRSVGKCMVEWTLGKKLSGSSDDFVKRGVVITSFKDGGKLELVMDMLIIRVNTL